MLRTLFPKKKKSDLLKDKSNQEPCEVALQNNKNNTVQNIADIYQI